MSFSKVVKNKDGVEKTIIANSEEELNEAISAVKAEQAEVAPDINKPADGNKEVSPDNKQTDPLVSDKFETNDVNQVGEPLPKEKPSDKVEKESLGGNSKKAASKK